jgi:tetratricopeptide (TPR) repeat protein
MFAVALGFLLFCTGANAEQARESSAAHQEVAADPFWVPPEMTALARSKIALTIGDRTRAEILLKFLVDPKDAGGLGIEYSNDKTRTIQEAWLERKANCLSLTMAYVMLAKQLHISAGFAESMEVASWSRAGDMVLKENHMVGVIFWNPPNTLVADFLTGARSGMRYGSYFLNRMTDIRAKSLFYSNRSVESLLNGDRATAMDYLAKALKIDPTSNRAWNIKGVIEKSEKKMAEAEISYKTAIRNNPNDVVAIGNLSALYKMGGYIEEASMLRSLEGRLRKLDPYYHAFLAQESLENKDYKKARKSIQRAIKIHSTDSDFYVTLSNIQLAQNNIGEAISALSKARQHAIPDRVEYLDFLINEYRSNLNSH